MWLRDPPGALDPAVVLAAVKDTPSRAAEVAVLDLRCARRRELRVGRDEGTGSAETEQRN